MRATINTWKESVCFYGQRFDLREERIVGLRQTKELYELYYEVERGKVNLLYIERDAYQSIHHLMKTDGWDDILVAKYIGPEKQKPSFMLKAQKKDYIITFDFDVEKFIVLKAVLNYQGHIYEDWTKISVDVQQSIKQVYTIIERYVFSYYKTNIIVDKNLYAFVQQHLDWQITDNLPLVKETVIKHFQECIEVRKTTQEYATSSSVALYKRHFDNPVIQAIVWHTLKLLNVIYATKQKDPKELLIRWLDEEFSRTKKELTEEQRGLLREEGFHWSDDEDSSK